METTQGSDRRLGFSLLFGLVGLLGALVMLAAAIDGQQLVSGWGFAATMLAATLLVSAIHLSE